MILLNLIASSVFPRFRRRNCFFGFSSFPEKKSSWAELFPTTHWRFFFWQIVEFLGEGPLAETHHKFRAHHTKHGSRLKRRQYVFHFRLLRRSRFGASPAAPSARRCRVLKQLRLPFAPTTCDCSSSSLPILCIPQQNRDNQPSFFK